jgi:hypothetical protein
MRHIANLIILLTLYSAFVYSQDSEKKAEAEITQIMQRLADANLRSDPTIAKKHFADELVLTSQSGKVYTKKDALLDIKNEFEKYENTDLRFIHLSKKIVLVNYQNIRKRKSLDEGKYRVTAVWTKSKAGWQIVSLQSSKIATGM